MASRLPSEVINLILQRLNNSDLSATRLINRTWYEASNRLFGEASITVQSRDLPLLLNSLVRRTNNRNIHTLHIIENQQRQHNAVYHQDMSQILLNIARSCPTLISLLFSNYAFNNLYLYFMRLNNRFFLDKNNRRVPLLPNIQQIQCAHDFVIGTDATLRMYIRMQLQHRATITHLYLYDLIGCGHFRNGYNAATGLAGFISGFNNLSHLTANFYYKGEFSNIRNIINAQPHLTSIELYQLDGVEAEAYDDEDVLPPQTPNETLLSLFITSAFVDISVLMYITDLCRSLDTIAIKSEVLQTADEQDEEEVLQIINLFYHFCIHNIENIYIQFNYQGKLYELTPGLVVGHRQLTNFEDYLRHAINRTQIDE